MKVSAIRQGNTGNIPCLDVLLKRGASTESRHRVHAVVCDSKGRILMSAGNPNYESYIRSALKPFQALPFINSGTCDIIKCNEKSIAIACSSHSGSKEPAREAFKILWNAELDVNHLQCPIPPGKESPLQHNCSGKHSAFLATCHKMMWPLEDYLKGNHPLQLEVSRKIAALIGIPSEELIAARDDCGAPTYLLQLNQMALLYAHLGESNQPGFERINRAINANPNLIAGEGLFDTEVLKRAHDQLISKGGAEGIQCISRLGEGIGLGIKVEDGSKRAKHAVAIHLLKQLDWLTPTAVKELEEQFLLLSPGVQLEVYGELGFQEN